MAIAPGTKVEMTTRPVRLVVGRRKDGIVELGFSKRKAYEKPGLRETAIQTSALGPLPTPLEGC